MNEFQGMMLRCPVKDKDEYVRAEDLTFSKDMVDGDKPLLAVEYSCQCGCKTASGASIIHKVDLVGTPALKQIAGMRVVSSETLSDKEIEERKASLKGRKEAKPEPPRHTASEGGIVVRQDSQPIPPNILDIGHVDRLAEGVSDLTQEDPRDDWVGTVLAARSEAATDLIDDEKGC